VRHDYVVVANNLGDLREVAGKLAAPDANSVDLAWMRDGENIRQHEVWAYRRYPRSGVSDPMAAGMADVVPGTEALTCFVDLQKKTLTVKLIPGSAEGEGTAVKMNARQGFPALKPSGNGRWESSVAISGDAQSDEAVNAVVGLFGFIVYS
jgi:hypothetical protein